MVDLEIDKLREKDLLALNLRTGPGKIVKVRPLTKLGPDDYPDSIVGNIPQWELTVPKQFSLVGTFRGTAPARLQRFRQSFSEAFRCQATASFLVWQP